jgi:DNA polymerase (family 10)
MTFRSDVDREYRELTQAGKLHRIAPRRFNPTGEAWLPVLHTRRGDRDYTALFSNTALAHKVRKTNDWVTLYHDAGNSERQCTVVTSQQGLLRGKRVVRGGEAECQAHYLSIDTASLDFGDPNLSGQRDGSPLSHHPAAA